ncbi:MAG: 30S ribosomal protein S5 [Elusimicrobia bacterium CG1_02_37_114]|nr:MAG: 30S ribosomal protein S5 [Elusimicrobia bacterium CG1_02_37_114]PIV52551.1 MAG: 30S ribosomal protein S5 [Elusimicrobia bacterium CG02_land_8_20_14_3_00_37_13]PIZ13280.1 MAG: 30S ribosomal protein S5 [Elusimicrobia bacterium CG_4_10_14_0_8_um_filter_37_32]
MAINEVPLSGSSIVKETVISINRVSKTVKGGKRLSFNACVVVGDSNGNVGVAVGKAKEVQQAIVKAGNKAKKVLIKVPIVKNTIPHEIIGVCGAAKVFLKPALPGTGVIAGGSVRAVVESVGIKDILTKCLGSRNPINVAYATIDGLKRLYTEEEILSLRGKI